MKIILTFVLLCVFGYVAYNADALYGQYLFKEMCEKDGGARFIKRVEKGQGWLDSNESRDPKRMELWTDGNKGFVRFKDKSGNLFDARLKSLPPYGTPREIIDGPQYTLVEPANLSVPVRYTQRYISENFNPRPDFLKLQSFGKRQLQIIDLQSNEVAATHTIFGYSWTKPERVILNGPTVVNCHLQTPAEQSFMTDIFKNGEAK